MIFLANDLPCLQIFVQLESSTTLACVRCSSYTRAGSTSTRSNGAKFCTVVVSYTNRCVGDSQFSQILPLQRLALCLVNSPLVAAYNSTRSRALSLLPSPFCSSPLALCVPKLNVQPSSTGQALLETLRNSLCGCITVDGSISIDLSSATTPDSSSTQLTAKNFSFLADVQEITGYLELKGVSVRDLLSLPSLRVIHGRELKGGHALVVDSVVVPEGVIFPKMSEIVTGNAYFSNVTGACGYVSVNWSDVLSNGRLQEGSTDTCVQGVCDVTCRHK